MNDCDKFLVFWTAIMGLIGTFTTLGALETGRKLGWTAREQELQKQQNREGIQ